MNDNLAIFVNWSTETFSSKPYENSKGEKCVDENCKWDGKLFSFQPGERQYFEAGIARHFAKHLAKRELSKVPGGEKHMSAATDSEGKFQDAVFLEYFNKGYIVDEVEQSDLPVEMQVIQKNKPLPPKKTKKTAEEEFPPEN